MCSAASAARAGDAPAGSDVSELMKRIEKLEASNRALASEVRRALPGGGTIALLRNPSQQRADAWTSLVASLQLAPPQ